MIARPLLAPSASIIAAKLAERLGVEPEGPVGRRLRDSCRAATPDVLSQAVAALAVPGLSPVLMNFYDIATNRETYFFRDRRQMVAMGEFLARRKGEGAAKIWSAGCATGEEAYTAAIVALRVLPMRPGPTVLGTDVSASALATAQAGVYRTGPMSSCRDLHIGDEAFLPLRPDGARCVDARLRQAVRFQTHNLMDSAPVAAQFDVVICRNVLLYMTADARKHIFGGLAQALVPGGWLLLGPGDAGPLANPSELGFSALDIHGITVFQRGGG